MPRDFGGTVSIVSAPPTPHSPPIAIPNRARSTSRVVRLGEKPDSNSSSEKHAMLTISVGRRPYLSASQPKINAPTGRITRVSIMPKATAGIFVLNSAAISFNTNTIRKKSNASRVQPR